MTTFGNVKTELNAGILLATEYDEITSPITTVSATLEDITGLSLDIVVPTGETARVSVIMSVECFSTGGSPAMGGWAVSIGGVDGTEIKRYLSGTADTGSLGCQSFRSALSAGTYTVKGRHRRVSGAATINTGVALMTAIAVLD